MLLDDESQPVRCKRLYIFMLFENIHLGTTVETHLYPNTLIAADMCLGWSGHVYRFRSSSGRRSTSWKMKQSKLLRASASTNPTLSNMALLNSPVPEAKVERYFVIRFVKWKK